VVRLLSSLGGCLRRLYQTRNRRESKTLLFPTAASISNGTERTSNGPVARLPVDIPAPMNMEEWQRRVKAEKDAARKKKSESSEILHGYRGELRDEELKLKKLREEERQCQLDAERNLHSYQAKELEGIKAMEQKTARSQHPVLADAASSASKNYMDGFNVLAAGSVSERAAAFATPTASSAAHNFHANAAFDDPVMVQHPTDDEIQQVTPEPVLNGTNPDTSTPQDAFSSFNNDFGGNVGLTSNATKSPDSSHERTLSEPARLVDEQRRHVSGTLGEPSSNDEVSLTKTNVLFSFGVVSIQNNPELFGYMAATEKVVSECLDVMKLSGIMYDPKLRPFVRTCVPDGRLCEVLP
jgi:hypothetical protein